MAFMDAKPEKRGFPVSSFSNGLRRRKMAVHPCTAASPTWRIRDFRDANSLIGIEPTPKGLHYTEVTESAWGAVIFGGGWAGSSRLSRSSRSFSSRSGSV